MVAEGDDEGEAVGDGGIPIPKGKVREYCHTGSTPSTPDDVRYSPAPSSIDSHQDWTPPVPAALDDEEAVAEGLEFAATPPMIETDAMSGIAEVGSSVVAQDDERDPSEDGELVEAEDPAPPNRKRMRVDARSPSPRPGPAIVRRRAPGMAPRLLGSGGPSLLSWFQATGRARAAARAQELTVKEGRGTNTMAGPSRDNSTATGDTPVQGHANGGQSGAPVTGMGSVPQAIEAMEQESIWDDVSSVRSTDLRAVDDVNDRMSDSDWMSV